MMERNFDKFDVCIIGASLAGNYLCYLLSNSDLSIAIIEEHKEIGLPFQCAGVVSQKLGKIINLPERLILNRVHIAKIVSTSGKFIKLSGAEVPYIIDRIGLDRFYYETVKNKDNINYFLGEKFKSLEYIKENKKKLILIETTNRIIKARMLIGCDGPLSSVANSLGIKNEIIYATQVRIKADFNEDEIVMYFDPRWKESFGWIVPEGKNIYRIGLGSLRNIAKNFNIFLMKYSINLEQKIDLQGGIIPYGTMNKLVFDNILLLGDSAGQVKSTTGGGIIMLLTAAKYAANCIQKCFGEKRFSKKFLKKYYESPCKKTIGRELRVHNIIRTLLESFTTKDFDKLLSVIKINKIENLISLYGDMDFPKALMFKLIKNPIAFSFFLKIFVKNPKIMFKILKLI
ncbi:hypothetical protein LCGC14_0492140 [marine sediment metagenome]|uniref:FAD-binding domain-containing protein n=1 Tax=marine sediment metagenome TaxID=412755 RepID=A0A0F9SBK0_9ZZZZ|nr:MAG: Digeranylgeranylglycerophospholipid reductase [Candidatus Lokiarchaeum sp. GC14_75]